MADSFRIPILFTVVLLLSLTTHGRVVVIEEENEFGMISWDGSSSHRSLLAATAVGLRRNNPISKCVNMVSKSQCVQKPKCRWCRSEVIDDMCFSSSEAWRLPQQVFTCD